MSYAKPSSIAEALLPIPKNAPPRPEKHPVLGRPSRIWEYQTATGEPLFFVFRFETVQDGCLKKDIRPVSCWRTENGEIRWEWKHIGVPRALLNLARLAASPEAEVIIVEGERTADAAAQLFPDCVVTTSSGGSNAAALSDWSVLTGRNCVIARDLDAPGQKYADAVIECLREARAARISTLNIGQIAEVGWQDGVQHQISAVDVPAGYDLADAVEAGWTAERMAAALAADPSLVQAVAQPVPNVENRVQDVPDDEEGPCFECSAAGVFKVFQRYDRKLKDTVEERIRICSPLEVIGFTRTAEGQEWGRVVEFVDPDGGRKNLVISLKDMVGGGAEVAKRLISEGLSLVPTRVAIEMLAEYLQRSNPDRRITTATMPGWCGETFAFPGGNYGPGDVRCDLGDADHRYKTAGTLEVWQEIPKLARGNSRLMFAISSAFVGPLLAPLGLESVGFNIVNPSSDGKTMLLCVAASVWGEAKNGGYVRSWKGSDSGLEAAAVLANDTFLALDEIGQADPKIVGDLIYLLANGVGKNRADVRGRALKTARWSCCILSTGEVTVNQVLSDVLRNKKASAGQKVRLVDVPADAGCDLGVFEDLNAFSSSREFGAQLMRLAGANYGHAARAYLAALTENSDECFVGVTEIIEAFVAEATLKGHSRQVQRVAAKFGVVAGAGELAASLGVLPWEMGEAIQAVVKCYDAWLKSWGDPALSSERQDAIADVQRFLSLHGAGRFDELLSREQRDTDGPEGPARTVYNRAGFRKTIAARCTYYVLPEIWRAEIGGGDAGKAESVAKTLLQAGFLEPGENGRLQKKIRVPGLGATIRCYAVTSDILGEGGGAPEEEPSPGDEPVSDPSLNALLSDGEMTSGCKGAC